MVIGTNPNLAIVEACHDGRVLGDDLATLVIVLKLRKESGRRTMRPIVGSSS